MKIQGNIIVGQSGGPTAAINASLAGVFSAGKKLCSGKVYGMLNGVEGLLSEKIIDMSAQITCDLDLELLKRTPSSYLGSCRFKCPKTIKAQKSTRNYLIYFTNMILRDFSILAEMIQWTQ